jgi:Leu/Phe-tRNA-protein transferase
MVNVPGNGVLVKKVATHTRVLGSLSGEYIQNPLITAYHSLHTCGFFGFVE